MTWLSGLPGRLPHSLSLSCRGPLGGRVLRTVPGPGSSVAQCWVRVVQLQTPNTATRGPLTRWGGGEGSTGADTTGGGGGLCPRSSQRTTGSHGDAQLWRGPPPWAYLSPDCQIQQSLAYPENSWGLLINSVPSNYSMDNRFWTNRKKCLKLNFSSMIQKALQNSGGPQGHCHWVTNPPV